jgi:uncharacterized protein (DUF342 family)
MIIEEATQKKRANYYDEIRYLDENAFEKELRLCKELGFNIDKLRQYNYNAMQLAEIRKGIAENLDVQKYLNPNLSWLEMEEIRLELSQGINMDKYREAGFDNPQVYQIRKGLSLGLDVSSYAKKAFLGEQMREIRKGLQNSPDFPIIFYLDPAFNYLQMREIRKGLEANIDVSNYAQVNVPYMKMRAIRKCTEDGMLLDENTIKHYNYGILEQMHTAFLNKVDISIYIQQHYDADQLEEINICLKENIPIGMYISPNMRCDAIKEIRLGIENGVVVDQYADEQYNWMQMRELRIGLEHQIDVTPYLKALYWPDQMREIRLGLEEGIDVSKYSSMMYTAKDMRKIREKILFGEYIGPDDDDEATDSGLDSSIENSTLKYMLYNKDTYLSFTQKHMFCWLTIPSEVQGKKYTKENITKFLNRCKITKNIDEKAIEKLVANIEYDKKVLVATGSDVINGEDGYYEYFFDTKAFSGITENANGEADFSKLDQVIKVNVGDIVAVYHKASTGFDGKDVFGNPVHARRGKESPILKGSGFMIMNDRVTYVSKFTGALSFHDNEINIKKILVVPEVKRTDKIMRFDGTVFVTGDVSSGSEIQATGDVIITGHLESSNITSGGNIMIKGGATCPVRGRFDAKGDVHARFLNGPTINAKNVCAHTITNCKINAVERVKTVGKDSVISGGKIQSQLGIETANLGNKANSETFINLGVFEELMAKYIAGRKDIMREEEGLAAILKQKDKFQELGAVSRELMQLKVKINAAANLKVNHIEELKSKQEELQKVIDNGKKATALIRENLYAGVVLSFSGVTYKNSENKIVRNKLIIRLDGKQENIIMVE